MLDDAASSSRSGQCSSSKGWRRLGVFGEPRYRQLVEDLQALPEGVDQRFGVVAIRDGREVGEGNVRAASTSTGDRADLGGRLGRRRLVLAGDHGRGALPGALGRPASPLYPVAEVEMLTDEPGQDAESLRTPATAQFLAYQRALSSLPKVRAGPLPQLPDDATVLSHSIAATMRSSTLRGSIRRLRPRTPRQGGGASRACCGARGS